MVTLRSGDIERLLAEQREAAQYLAVDLHDRGARLWLADLVMEEILNRTEEMTMAWRYSQSTGQLYHEGELITTGYSGHGDGKNCSAMQDKRNVGPLPRGVYAIGKPHDTTTHGPFVMALTPFGPPPEWNPSAEEKAEYDRLNQPEHLADILSGALAKFSWMFGRSGFLIHGDSIVHIGQASQGCIILPRPVRERIATSGDDELEVTV